MILYYIYLIISPILWGIAFLLSFIFPKMRERTMSQHWVYREGIEKLKKLSAKPILLFHAASTGEFEQLKPILLLLNREEFTLIVTFFSATVYRKENHSPLFDLCLYHPLDSIFSAILFFDQIKPTAYIVNRHDLWPSHLWIAKQFGIKTIFINANIHEASKRNVSYLRGFNKILLGNFDLILTGSQRLESNIKAIKNNLPVYVTGDSRFDQVLDRKERNPRNHFTNITRKLVVLGSLIPSDYPVIFGGIRKLWGSKNGDQIEQQLIVVPHEVARKNIDTLIDSLQRFGFSYSLYSKTKALGKSDAMIIDCVGILAELYSYGFCAYVGAGFGTGVHSTIEPAVYGIPVAYGPNMSLLDEAVEMESLGIGTIVNTPEDFSSFLQRNQTLSENFLTQSIHFIESKKSSSVRITDNILTTVREVSTDLTMTVELTSSYQNRP